MHRQEVEGLPRVGTPMGRSNMVERTRQAPRLKGSFLAPRRTHSRGHEQTATSGCFVTLRSVHGRCERRAAHSPSPQGEVNPTSTDALVGSMKAPVRVADVDVGGCRRGALRGGEQRLAFDAGEELGGSDFEFQ